eukprot:9388108-Karenia_brevis.AAC.1
MMMMMMMKMMAMMMMMMMMTMDMAWLDEKGAKIYPIRELLCVRQVKFWPLCQAVGLDMDPRNNTCWRHCRSGQFADLTDHF